MSAVPEITPAKRNFKLPDALRRLEGWLVWRCEQAGLDAKPLKVPYYTNGRKRAGTQGSNEDRSKLVGYGVALRRMLDRKYDGIGLAMLPDWGLTAIDIDNCVGPDGELPEIVHHLAMRTYVEYSPSGNGVRAFLRGNLGNHKSPTKGNDYGLETFYSTGYVTITGNVLPECELIGSDEKIADVDDTIRDLCEQRFGNLARPDVDPDDPFLGLEPRLNLSVGDMEGLLAQLDPDMGRETWIKVGMALHHETQGDDTGFYIWNDWSSQGAKYVSEDDLRTQWTSFDRREGARRHNVTMATVKMLVKEASPDASKIVAALDEVEQHDGPEVATSPDFDGKFRVISAGAMTRQPPIPWIVKGILPKADVAAIYGEPGSGKSFVALDMLCAIARGVDWCGRSVKQGRCIIVAAEGAGGYGGRIKAYCDKHNIDPANLDIGVIPARPNIMEAEDIGELAKAVKAAGGAYVIAIDTLAQVTPGANENSGEDMGRALANARVLRDVTGAMILLIHHSGKDASKGLRGWSGVNGAVDAAILCWRDEDGKNREMRITKQKDGDDGMRWGFNLETVEIGVDEEGETRTSCVVNFLDTPRVAPRQPDSEYGSKIRRRGKWQKLALEVACAVPNEIESMSVGELHKLIMDAREGEMLEDARAAANIKRAMDEISREGDGPFKLQGNRAIMYN